MNILQAEIKGGQVVCEGITIKDAVLLCEGKTASAGFLVIDKDKYFYAVKTTPDITKTLDLAASAIDLLTTITNIISTDITDAVPTGGGPVKLPNFAADIELLKQQATQLKQQIDNLKQTQI
jgi:hypothetical protein